MPISREPDPKSTPVGSRATEAPVETPTRKLLTRSEASILGGMALAVISLFQTWREQVPEIPAALSASAMHLERFIVFHNGFGAGVAGPMTVCAVLCASTLFWEMTERNRMALTAVAGAGAFACVVIPLARFALLPGLLLGLTAGLLLMFGTLDRYKYQEKSGGKA